MKKKILCALLCLVTLAGLMSGCSGNGDEDVGAAIPVYLNTQIINFDPARAYTDDTGSQILGLLYAGLTKIQENGKVKGDMAEKWTYTENADKNYYMLEFTLRETCWSDGRQVSADDFVFAWKRIMNSDFMSEGAALLYDLKNAKDVKLGNLSIDDLGITAVDKTILQIEFSHSIDVDAFLEVCASPYLVPLREDKVSRETDWASSPALIVSNGPFTVRTNECDEESHRLVLERNLYYFRDKDKDKIQKSVTPYRLVINYGEDAAAHLEAFNNGTEVYLNNLPLSERQNYKKQATVKDTFVTHTYFFNTTRAPFNDSNVRRALSLAIDRNQLVETVVFAKAAQGFVNSRVYETNRKTTFRSVGGEVISASANMDEARQLIQAANISEKSFTLTIRPNEVDRAVAEYCKSVWEQLGFSVTVEETTTKNVLSELEYELIVDDFTTKYRSGDFDVIAVDWTSPSVYAWGTLAPFSLNFSGGAIDITSENFEQVPHITGYNSEEYNALIDSAYNAGSVQDRMSILHQAEQMLAQDMPVMPLFEYQNAFLVAKDLKSLKVSFSGYTAFTKANLKNPESYGTEAQS